MKAPELDKLRRSGFISATAREHGKKLIKPGARIGDIAKEVEKVILDMGGKPAFPAQMSRNHIAAHYCSPPDDPTVVQPDDIVKLDLGTQVDGYVTDNAVTVDLRDGPDSLIVTASQMALENAISVMGPGASITEIGRQIEETAKAMGYQPIVNLTGHGVARYTIHCAPSIPNYPDPRAGRLRPNMTIACEPFVCDGRGYIEAIGKSEVFMLSRDIRPKDSVPAEIVQALSSTEGLPFARRQILPFFGSAQKVEDALKLLKKKGLLDEYPPLCEKPGVRVAQTEHTIFITETGAEVVTRLPGD
ncbi:MAG: type II methionyl aminopeptidase [Planctomycetes bacterium]|nr:type II methionyl aminopeptidase [Planctomycetota bacterium]